ncbi:MAG TPA: tetratricopeptide repeat protein [Candidatus Angelobacter sp.]
MASFLSIRGIYSMAINGKGNMNATRFSLLVLCATLYWSTAAMAADDSTGDKLPVTTSSAAAARYYENGMVHYENHRWNLALNDWHEAVRLDPNFALAYTWICMTTVDPAEESSNRALAKAAVNDKTPGEKLMVRWMAGIHENNYVEGISAMNDLLALYPKDKRLNFLIAYWLYKQDQYDLAEKLTLRSLQVDSDYATAYNQMGYLYSRRGEYDKALEAAGKYVKLLPNEPNPHDSYGEMLRLSGRFEEALEQYREALEIDPTFYISQKELGETYAIMGEGEKARFEYAKAVHDAPSTGLKAEYLQKSAMTYVRDGQYDAADKAFVDAAEKAHAMEQWLWEARAYRMMAMYGPDPVKAAQDLKHAEELLAAHQDIVAQADLNEEAARIWRVRAERAVAAANHAEAVKAVDTLERMAGSGGSINVERTWHGAAGTLLMAQKKYVAAIPHLEADFANPISLKLLITACEKSKAKARAAALRQKLIAWKIPSIEEALVVPGLRAQKSPVVSKN